MCFGVRGQQMVVDYSRNSIRMPHGSLLDARTIYHVISILVVQVHITNSFKVRLNYVHQIFVVVVAPTDQPVLVMQSVFTVAWVEYPCNTMYAVMPNALEGCLPATPISTQFSSCCFIYRCVLLYAILGYSGCAIPCVAEANKTEIYNFDSLKLFFAIIQLVRL